MYRIVKKEPLNPSVTRMRIEAPLVAQKVQPGQFIILRVEDNGERIPLTVAGYDRTAGTVDIIFQIVGATTEKLNHKPCVMQIPIGLEDQLKGVVDLVEMKAYYFEGANGDDMIEKEIPAELVDQANEYRTKLIDCCADYSDEIMEKAMEGQYGVDEIDKALIKKTIREATIPYIQPLIEDWDLIQSMA